MVVHNYAVVHFASTKNIYLMHSNIAVPAHLSTSDVVMVICNCISSAIDYIFEVIVIVVQLEYNVVGNQLPITFPCCAGTC